MYSIQLQVQRKKEISKSTSYREKVYDSIFITHGKSTFIQKQNSHEQCPHMHIT